MNLKSTFALAALISVLAAPLAGAQQAQPWKSIQTPPLSPFHPQQPKRIELPNGLVIFLQEDHELPFINGIINIRGGSRNEEPSKAGMISLYGETWRTSGTAKMNGDALDDLLEAKAAKVETGGDIDSTAVSWSCLKADEDQVFGIAVELLEHPALHRARHASWSMARRILTPWNPRSRRLCLSPSTT